MRKRILLVALLSAVALVSAPPAAAQVVGRCFDQVRGMAFDLHANGWLSQVGNPGNAGQTLRDPSGRTFLMLPSVNPHTHAYFLGWQGEIVEIERMRGARVVGGCEIQPGIVPPPPYERIYQPPVMHASLGVETPQGFLPIPQAIARPEQPFATPMIASEGQAERCYRQSVNPSYGLDRDRFGACMVGAMTGRREAEVFQCVRAQQAVEAQALCLVGALGGSQEQQVARALESCHAQYGGDYSRYPLCMAGFAGGDAARLLACVEQQGRSGGVTAWGTMLCYAPQRLELNSNVQLVVQCAIATKGEPYSFTACAGGPMAARELDRCLNHGVGGANGCFGRNNDLVRGFREVGQALAQEFGPGNDLVRTWNSAVHDLTVGPGPTNDVVRTFQNVGNELARAPGNVARTVERAVPRIRVKI